MMKRRMMLFFWAAALIVGPSMALAQKDKAPSLPPGDLFFTVKGQPSALERNFPGITGALLLTNEQKQRLQEVQDETTRSKSVMEAAKTLKSDPNATDAQKAAARTAVAEARAKLQSEVASILTETQKALVKKINATSAEARQAVSEKFQAQYATAKGDQNQLQALHEQIQQEFQAEFSSRLAGILTAEQRAGMEQAAAAQRAADERARQQGKK